jgi:uncharacterized damage-inducible protein DinB
MEATTMPESNPLEVLLKHNAWATRQILEACPKLTSEQFHRNFEIGRGNLHDATTHILGAMRNWTDMLSGRETRPRLETGPQRTAGELLALLPEIITELDSVAHAHPLDEIISAVRGGKSYSFTRGAVLTHVTTHGVHHRAQCLNMLRHLGVSPLPQSSVLEWLLAVDPIASASGT